MNMRPVFIGVACALAWIYLRQTTPTDSTSNTTNTASVQLSDYFFQGVNVIKKALTGWDVSMVPSEYQAVISETENARGIPSGLLARLLYQESHYRPDIISGATRSSVGALGIAQFMPATAGELGINPLDPYQAIPAAGLYLSRLYRSTGAWDKALAAYNWGIGNVQRKGLSAAPPETVVYYTNIMADVGLA